MAFLSLGDLIVGRLHDVALPATPTDELKLYLDRHALADLWIALTWGG